MKRLLVALLLSVVVVRAVVWQTPIASGPRRRPLPGARRSAGAVSQNVSDSYGNYITSVQLGTPPQTVQLVIEATNSDLVLFKCPEGECPGAFDPYGSSTFHKLGDNNAGEIDQDTFALGPLSIAGQGFLTEQEDFDVAGGILGLGIPVESVIPVPTLLTNILSRVEKPLFTVFLKPDTNGRDRGTITYGAEDHTHCTAPFTYVPNSHDQNWQVTMDSFSIGTVYTNPKPMQALIDSGGDYLMAPTSDFAAIVKAIGASFDFLSGTYTVPCNTSLPDLLFTIGGVSHAVHGTQYVKDLGLGGGRCALMIENNDIGSGFGADWFLADGFVISYCTVFDLQHMRVGFAKAIF